MPEWDLDVVLPLRVFLVGWFGFFILKIFLEKHLI